MKFKYDIDFIKSNINGIKFQMLTPIGSNVFKNLPFKSQMLTPEDEVTISQFDMEIKDSQDIILMVKIEENTIYIFKNYSLIDKNDNNSEYLAILDHNLRELLSKDISIKSTYDIWKIDEDNLTASYNQFLYSKEVKINLTFDENICTIEDIKSQKIENPKLNTFLEYALKISISAKTDFKTTSAMIDGKFTNTFLIEDNIYVSEDGFIMVLGEDDCLYDTDTTFKSVFSSIDKNTPYILLKNSFYNYEKFEIDGYFINNMDETINDIPFRLIAKEDCYYLDESEEHLAYIFNDETIIEILYFRNSIVYIHDGWNEYVQMNKEDEAFVDAIIRGTDGNKDINKLHWSDVKKEIK